MRRNYAIRSSSRHITAAHLSRQRAVYGYGRAEHPAVGEYLCPRDKSWQECRSLATRAELYPQEEENCEEEVRMVHHARGG